MKISIATNPFGTLPPSGLGAVERLWYNLGIYFASQGHKVTFYCKASQQQYLSASNITYYTATGYKRTGSLLGDLILDFLYSVRTLKVLKNCDVFIMNTFFLPLLCPLFRNRFKVAVYNVARYPKRQLRFYNKINRLSCVSNAVATAAIAQSPNIADLVKVIHNPVDTMAFFYAPKHKVSVKGVQSRLHGRTTVDVNKDCVIGFSGRIHPEKGIDLLVKAYASLCMKGYKLRLRIIGPTSIEQGGGGDRYVELLNVLAGEHPIEWVDAISDAETLATELRKCDIYCYPSIAEFGETFGVAPLEAMAVGCAAVVSALECFQDFVEDGTTALIFDHRAKHPAEELANKIEFLIVNPEVRIKLSHAGANIAHLKFNNAYIAEEYLKDFVGLLGELSKK